MSTLPLVPSSADQALSQESGEEPGSRFGAGLWKRVEGHTLYALGDQVVYSFGNMVIAASLSRHCVQTQFGVYILTQRTMDVLIQLSNVLLWGPFTFHLPGMPEARRATYQGSVLHLQLLLCVLFSGALWAAVHWTATPRHADLHGTFSALVLAGAGLLFREFTRRMYFAQMRLREAFWTDAATVLLQIAGVVGLRGTSRFDVQHVLGVLSAAAMLVSLWWWYREWQSWTFQASAVPGDLKQSFRLGRWFLGSNMVYLASAQANPWVLNAYLGGASVGRYAISESLVNIPRVALTSMQNLMGPLLARAQVEGGKSRVRVVVRQMNRILLVASALFACVLVLIGPQVARWIYRSAPGNTRVVAFLLSINLVVYACTLAQSYGLTVLNRADTTLYANGLGLAAQASVCVLFVRSFHVPGAAAALVLGSATAVAARQWFYSREIART